MVQATTPTFLLTLPDTVDVSIINNMVFTIVSGNVSVSKSGEDLKVEGNTVSVYLSQEDTLKLPVGVAQLQLNWTYENGSRACSTIVNVRVDNNLYKEVME